PGDLPKHATSFDLPIALGLLAASGQIEAERLDQYAIVGELALDGSMRPVKGALSMAMAAAKHSGVGLSEAGQTRGAAGLGEAGYSSGGLRGIILPAANADEAAVV